MVKRAQKCSKKRQRIINALNLHQKLLNSWVREDVKKYIILGVGPTWMAPLIWPHFVKCFPCNPFPLQWPDVMCWNVHRAICRGQKQICADQTTHSLQFLCNIFHVLLSLSFGQMLCGGSGWVLERTRTNLERTKAKATRATAPFIPALNLRICKIIS